MRVFMDGETWGGKVNFVDESDALVGFDISQDCCEYFGWYVSDDQEAVSSPPEWSEEQGNTMLAGYLFDRSFLVENTAPESCGEDHEAIFRLTKAEAPDLFLHLFNHHNGYYAHGFTFVIGGVKMKEGYL